MGIVVHRPAGRALDEFVDAAIEVVHRHRHGPYRADDDEPSLLRALRLLDAATDRCVEHGVFTESETD